MNVFTVREAHNSVADYSIACPELDVFNLFAGCAQTSWQPSPNAEFGAGLLKDVVIKGIKWPPRKVCAFVLFRCTSIQTSVLVCPTMLVLQLSFPLQEPACGHPSCPGKVKLVNGVCVSHPLEKRPHKDILEFDFVGDVGGHEQVTFSLHILVRGLLCLIRCHPTPITGYLSISHQSTMPHIHAT
jgi:hypothetical protein